MGKIREAAALLVIANRKLPNNSPRHNGVLNDAMLDATNVYNWYRRKDLRSADCIGWEDAALQELIKKK